MKKLLLSIMALTGVLTAEAESTYPYLTFETTDGDKVSVSTTELSLSISGTTLTAGSEMFTLTNLSKMYFSATDETVTGISEVRNEMEEASEIYDLRGHKVEKSQMRHGEVYIVKTKSKTYKLTVK
jgi:hypothetical protein